MAVAESVGGSEPFGGGERGADDVTDRERALLVYRKNRILQLVLRHALWMWIDGQQTVRVLGLYPALAINAEKARQFAVGHAFEQGRFPTHTCGREGDGADGVSDVVVAIAKSPLAVLP